MRSPSPSPHNPGANPDPRPDPDARRTYLSRSTSLRAKTCRPSCAISIRSAASRSNAGTLCRPSPPPSLGLALAPSPPRPLAPNSLATSPRPKVRRAFTRGQALVPQRAPAHRGGARQMPLSSNPLGGRCASSPRHKSMQHARCPRAGPTAATRSRSAGMDCPSRKVALRSRLTLRP